MTETTFGDWIQIVVAIVALFGGGYAGAKQAALSLMHVENRRRILDLAPSMAITCRPFSDLHLPGRQPFSSEYASPLPHDSRAVIPIDQVMFVMDRQDETRLSELEAAEAEVQALADLLPLSDRLSHRRFLRDTAAVRALATSLRTGIWIRGDEVQWVVEQGPGGSSAGLTRLSTVSRDASTGEWMVGDGICSFGGPSLPEWRSYEYRVGPANTSGGDFFYNGALLDWDTAWRDFAGHLHRQLRPGRWRNVKDKLYRTGLLWDWLRRRL